MNMNLGDDYIMTILQMENLINNNHLSKEVLTSALKYIDYNIQI